MTVTEWQSFLRQWSEDWLVRDKKISRLARKRHWLGSKGATAKQIAQLEKRLGYELPPSYRNFLLTTNGWSRTTDFIKRVLPISKIEWLEIHDPQLLDVWSPEDIESPDDKIDETYFSDERRSHFDPAHLRGALLVAEPVDDDSLIYLLNPLVVAPNGEWEAWRFANWIPGAERFPSFELLMRSEYALFAGKNNPGIKLYHGIYAHEQPRHVARKIGKARVKPKRLKIPELVGQLDSMKQDVRLSAAKQLLNEFCPHDPENEYPEIVEPLSRIIKSDLEVEVKSAAVAMLGSYGDIGAVEPLLYALEKHELMMIAISALYYLVLYNKDPRISNAMVKILDSAQSYNLADKALSVLEEIGDKRIVKIALRMLDEPIYNKSVLDESSRMSFRFKCAFIYAKFAEHATDELVKRLTHSNAEIRAASAGALREAQSRDISLAQHLNPLLDDPDPTVREQASISLSLLEPAQDFHESSIEQVADAMQWLKHVDKIKLQRKKRF